MRASNVRLLFVTTLLCGLPPAILAAPIAAVVEKGVHVVVIDSPVGGRSPEVFIATDNRAAGTEAGHLLASLVSDNDEVALLKHIQNSGATGERETGALNGFREVHP